MLEIRNLTKSYAGLHVASDISFEARAGETFLLGAKPRNLRFHHADAVPVLLGLAKDVGELPFDRIEPVGQRIDRRLRRRRIVTEARGVGRLASREDPLLQLAGLLLQPVDALLRGRALLRGGGSQCESGQGNEGKSGTKTHDVPQIGLGRLGETGATRLSRG